jgi:ABC-type transport system substrate-binding protein
MTSKNYWTNFHRRRLTRRGFMGAAGAGGAGLAALAAVGCGDDDDDDNGVATNTPTTGEATPTPGQQGPTPTPAPKSGGVARGISSNATYDTFDASRSRFSPVGSIIGWTHQRAVQWDSFKEGRIGGAFAEKWETPDGQTYTFKIRPNSFYHEKPPVNGRQAVAEDLKFHIERNKSGNLTDGTADPNFYRKDYYQVVDSVTAPDNSTVVVKLKQPSPLFLNLLAQTYEGIQAPEAVKQFEKDYAQFHERMIIGTGPFILKEFSSEGRLKLVRNEKFHKKANLNGFLQLPLFTDQAAQQAAWEQKQVEGFGPSTIQVLNDVRERFKGKIRDVPNFSANPIICGSYYMGNAPWNNANLIGAIFRAYDRRQLIQQFHGGRGAMSGSIPPTQGAFGVTEGELITFPGYLQDRDKENTEARKMWEAGGGPALGDVTIDIPDIFEGLYQAGAIITAMLNKNLGTSQFKAKVEPYSTITSKIVQQKYGSGSANLWYGWDTEVLDPEPTSFLAANYHSEAAMAKQSFAINIPELDAILAKVQFELDQQKRADMTRDAERLLLKAWGGGRPYSHVQISNTLYWNYYHSAESAPFSTAHLAVNVWIDTADPTYQGRPSDAGLL